MKILLTGATGFIGQKLAKILLDKNYEVFCIVRKNSDKLKIDLRASIFEYNENINVLIEYFQDKKFDGVVHLASYFMVLHTQDDISSLITSNIKFGTELLEACKVSKVSWFINTGTFWQNYENQDYNPVNLYAATKEAFQKIAKYYTETSGLIFVTIKLNDTFGADDTRNKIFNIWNRISKTGDFLEMSNGEQIIDISYIDDVIFAYEILILHLNSNKKQEFKNKEFVVTNSERISLKGLSEVFEEVTNLKLNIKWGAKSYRDREVMMPYNQGKIIQNWKQQYTLKEAMQKMIKLENNID